MNISHVTSPSAGPLSSASNAPRRQAVIVLGMHRSGTSALARMLSLLGCGLPRNLMPANVGNRAGHWESNAVMALNDELLAAAGSAWDDWLPVNPRFSETPLWPAFVERGRAVLREEFSGEAMFVLKDPRICRLAPLWLEVLAREAIEPVIVLPLRNPIEVARSLAARDGFDEPFGLLLWLRHVLDAEAASRGRARVFVSYDELLSDWEVLATKISEATGAVWPRLSPMTAIEVDDFLTPELRHHTDAPHNLSRRQTISPWIAETHAILERWSKDGEQTADHARLDSITAAFDRATPAFARPLLAARQARERLAQLGAERDGLAGERDALTAQRDTLTGERDAAHGRIATIEDEQAQMRAQFAEADGQLRHQLAIETSTLRQREEELAQLAAELSVAREAHAAETAGNLEAIARLEAASAELAEAAAIARTELTERFGEIAALSNLLQQREAESAGLQEDMARRDLELTLERQALAHAQAERDVALSEQARRAEEAATARKELAERFGEIATLSGLLRQRESESAGLKEDAARRDAELTLERQALAEARAERDAARSEQNQQAEDAAAARREVSQRFTEIAQLSSMLRSSENMAESRKGDAEWLRQVSAIISGFPRWWALMPSHVRRRWEHARLKQRGLFDADAYLSRYPDVAKAGMPPLRHYLLHGLQEGRSR